MPARPVCRTLVAALFIVVSCSVAWATSTWDPTAQFSTANGNPNGVWSYGYSNTYFAGGYGEPDSTTLYTSTCSNCLGESGDSAWYSLTNPNPTRPGVMLDLGQLWLAVNTDEYTSELIFTAPFAGNYVGSADFSGVENAGGVTVGIVIDGSPVAMDVLEMANGEYSFSSSGEFFLEAGQTVILYASPSDPGVGGQLVRLDATIAPTPEGGTGVYVLLGGGMLAGMMLLRRWGFGAANAS